MGTIIGAIAGIILFLIYGLLPAFRLGSLLALLFLNKVTRRSVDPTPASRAFIIFVVIICILSGAAFSLFIGAIIGSLFLL
jgi:hypothetical protein